MSFENVPTQRFFATLFKFFAITSLPTLFECLRLYMSGASQGTTITMAMIVMDLDGLKMRCQVPERGVEFEFFLLLAPCFVASSDSTARRSRNMREFCQIPSHHKDATNTNHEHHKKPRLPHASPDEETKKQQLNCQTSTESSTHKIAKRGNLTNSSKTRLSRPAASHALRTGDVNGKQGRRHGKLPSSPTT